MFTRVCGRGLQRVAMLVFLVGAHTLPGLLAGELEQRFQDTLKRAGAGDVQAMYSLGETYELGMGTDSNRGEALKWYRAAADKGHPEGAYQVGYAYYWGKGVSKDRGQAFAWFLRAAEGGSQAAMPYLSKMYALGQGVAQDKGKAAEWSARAAATQSNLHAPPPAPEIKQAPEPEAAPEPPAEPADKAAPVAETAKPPAPAKPKPAEPKVAKTTKPAPRPAAKPKAEPSPARRVIERLLAAHWHKDDRPALYLPSGQTQCEDQGEQLVCNSEPRRSSLLGRPYAFRLIATLGEFTRQGRFTLTYQPQMTGVLQAPPGGYVADDSAATITDEELKQRVERAPEQLSCELHDQDDLQCTDAKGQVQTFKAVTPTP